MVCHKTPIFSQHIVHSGVSFIEVESVPLPELLAPFCAIIRSPLSTGPITSAALSALHSFFLCGLINPHSISLEAALAEVSNTVARCKFEASDMSGDEVALLKIMTVIQACMCSDVGHTLGDIEVCEMLETVLTTCCQMRLSGALFHSVSSWISLKRRFVEILRRSAEQTMHAIVRTVFSRLNVLDPVKEEEKLVSNAPELEEAGVKMSVSTDVVSSASQVVSETSTAVDPPEEESKPAEQPAVPTPKDSAKAECMYSRHPRIHSSNITTFRRPALNFGAFTRIDQHSRSQRSSSHRFDASHCSPDSQRST